MLANNSFISQECQVIILARFDRLVRFEQFPQVLLLLRNSSHVLSQAINDTSRAFTPFRIHPIGWPHRIWGEVERCC
jgi:hypothetical protein